MDGNQPCKTQVLPTKTGAVKISTERLRRLRGKCQVDIAYIDPGDDASAEIFRRALKQENQNRDMLYIFGGGHVASAVAPIALKCGFEVTVIDDRAEFASSERFPGCQTIVAECFDGLPDIVQGDKTYIVIMTRGHAFDEKVLAWALKKRYRYLGMMGSKSKRGALYNNLLSRGEAVQSELDTIHCPIGIAIGAQSPAEIAVSVAEN
jgi:xanthine dehydrogenase accessory factor